MGSRMVEKLLQDGHEVVVWNRTASITDEFVAIMSEKGYSKHLTFVYEIAEFPKLLTSPRIFWLMLPAGNPTKEAFENVLLFSGKNDILIDGGNAYFKDSEVRYRVLQESGILYLGIGVSGGIIAEKQGYPLMVGGNESAYKAVLPILKTLAKPFGGYSYLGQGGVGHFVKMVHNGIEYGMMQAIGEGFGVIEKSPYKVNLLSVSQIWQEGSIISGFLLDRATETLEKDPLLSNVNGIIDSASLDAVWTVDQAKTEEVPIGIIEQSVQFRKLSQTDVAIQNSFAAKMVASMRNEFGGHGIKEKK